MKLIITIIGLVMLISISMAVGMISEIIVPTTGAIVAMAVFLFIMGAH